MRKGKGGSNINAHLVRPGRTTVDFQICRIDDQQKCETVRNAVVDTGAEVSAIRSKIIRKLKIALPNKKQYTLANNKKITKRFGTALIRYGGRSTSDDVIALPDNARPLLGVRALGGLGYSVNPKTKELVREEATLLL